MVTARSSSTAMFRAGHLVTYAPSTGWTAVMGQDKAWLSFELVIQSHQELMDSVNNLFRSFGSPGQKIYTPENL